MSLLTLPDEILYKIANCCVADHYFDAEFHGKFLNQRNYYPPVHCVNKGVLALSLGNSRIRTLCVPLLFASIAMDLGSSWHVDYLRRALERRPHIAEHIRSLTSYAQTEPRLEEEICLVNLFAQLLHMLPRVMEIPKLPRLTEDMIHAICVHPTIKTVHTAYVLTGDYSFLPLPLPADAHRPPDPLKKVTMSLVALADYILRMRDTWVWDVIKGYLEQGMNIDRLELRDKLISEPCTRAKLTLPFNRVNNVTIIHHSLERSDAESLHEWLPSFLARLSGLSSICFQSELGGFRLPLFCGLEREALHPDFRIISYGLKPAQKQVSEDTSTTSDSWEEGWTPAYVQLRFEEVLPVHPVQLSILSKFADSVSSITELDLFDLFTRDGEELSVPIADAVHLIPDQLRVFDSCPHLRSLLFGTVSFPQNSEMERLNKNHRLVIDLAKGLFEVLPSVERMRIFLLHPVIFRLPFEFEGREVRELVVQKRPVGSRDVEISVTPIYREE